MLARPPVAINKFCAEVGISPITAYRMRKRGWLSTLNIAGRQYVSMDEIERFNARAAAGEFAQIHVTPKRSRK